MIWREGGPFVIGQERHALLWAQVGEDDASGFFARVRRVAHFEFQRAARRLCRSFQHVTVDIVFPAVIDAPQAALFVATVKEGGAAVRTVLMQKPDAALSIAKGHEIFTKCQARVISLI